MVVEIYLSLSVLGLRKVAGIGIGKFAYRHR